MYEIRAISPSGNEHDKFIPRIYEMFRDEFQKSSCTYDVFINEKNLGVKANIDTKAIKMYGKMLYTNMYNIVNEKQWLLAKLKHGL